MNDYLKPYLNLIPFIAKVLGPHHEVVLNEIGELNQVVAIENGYISGRKVGSPLTNKALEIIQQRLYEDKDWMENYLGLSANNRPVRCSTYFIKDDNGELVGLLCINFDDAQYRNLINQILHLCHPKEFVEKNAKVSYAPALVLSPSEPKGGEERFGRTTNDVVTEIIDLMLASSPVPVSRMTQDEKMEIVDKLNNRGIFLIKGSVSLVADALSCSEPTIYRYLSKLNKQ